MALKDEKSGKMEGPTPRAKRNYYILILSVISMQITVSTIYMVLPIFFEGYGISKAANGVLISVGTFAGIISALIAGKLSDKYGRKPFLIIGTSLYSLVFFMFALADRNFNNFLILRFIEGLGYYMTPTIITAMAADIFPSWGRGRAMSLYTMANGVGQLVGPMIAGVFIAASNFSTYFIFSGAFVAVSAVVMTLFVRETLSKETRAEMRQRSQKSGIRGFFVSFKGLGFVFGIFLVALLFYRTGYTMVDPLFSLYLKNELHIPIDASMGYLYSIKALCTLAFAPVAGIIADKYGRKNTFLLGISITTATMFSYTLVSSYEHVFLVRAVDSTASAILVTSIRTMIADLVSPEMRGFGMGVYSTVTQESSTLGAIFGGIIADVYNFSTIFLIASSMAAICLIIVLVGVHEPKGLIRHKDHGPKVSVKAEDGKTRSGSGRT